MVNPITHYSQMDALQSLCHEQQAQARHADELIAQLMRDNAKLMLRLAAKDRQIKDLTECVVQLNEKLSDGEASARPLSHDELEGYAESSPLRRQG